MVQSTGALHATTVTYLLTDAKFSLGEPSGEGCVCNQDIEGDAFTWCTICKNILHMDDYDDSDGSFDGSFDN